MGSCWYPTTPASKRPTVRSAVATGRRMNGSEMLIARHVGSESRVESRESKLRSELPTLNSQPGFAPSTAPLRRIRLRPVCGRRGALALRPRLLAERGPCLHLAAGAELALPVHHHLLALVEPARDAAQVALGHPHLARPLLPPLLPLPH